MLQAFEEFKDDPDIYVNASAIQEAIFSPWQESHPKAIESIGFARKPGTKVTIMEMLQSLLISFSEPHFQEEIAKLKLDYDALAGRCTFANLSQKVSVPDPQGYYHLPGRAELALQLQQPVLTCFGFSPTRGGVCDMVRHCVPYLSDLAVAELFDNINMTLGSIFIVLGLPGAVGSVFSSDCLPTNDRAEEFRASLRHAPSRQQLELALQAELCTVGNLEVHLTLLAFSAMR